MDYLKLNLSEFCSKYPIDIYLREHHWKILTKFQRIIQKNQIRQNTIRNVLQKNTVINFQPTSNGIWMFNMDV